MENENYFKVKKLLLYGMIGAVLTMIGQAFSHGCIKLPSTDTLLSAVLSISSAATSSRE